MSISINSILGGVLVIKISMGLLIFVKHRMPIYPLSHIKYFTTNFSSVIFYLRFMLPLGVQGMSQLELEDEVQDDLKRATGEFTKDGDDANKLNRILQLTGFSDPVYAEAYVTVHHYDIVLDVTVVNRTKETLQNLCLELATMGDLKLVERPQNYVLAPESSRQIRANIKVSSTETGVIFGNIVYETASNLLDRSVVVLNDIHIDIMDYISPASCPDVAFRTMWAEFEWENKVFALLRLITVIAACLFFYVCEDNELFVW